MVTYTLPYGRSYLTCEISDRFQVEVVSPVQEPGVFDPGQTVRAALDQLLGGFQWGDFQGIKTAAIAVNDKTRPVPHRFLLPPLLARLEGLGLPPDQICLLIATGAHPPMDVGEYSAVLPQDILACHPVYCHDADDASQLKSLGDTSRGTPVWINRRFLDADLRLVVGNIEPHQFQGFSGGVKSASIGLAGRETVNHNHALMTAPGAVLGEYEQNPARQDVEEIGRLVGVHLALNCILNDNQEILQVLAGAPDAVMAAGIPMARALCMAPVELPFDLVVASPGGHPKDINLYQAQKALAHARRVTKTGGTVILAAACPEGAGSRRYEHWVSKLASQEAVLTRFPREGFQVGPHKAYQIARDAVQVQVLLVSEMAPTKVRRLLLNPAATLQEAVDDVIRSIPASARIGVMPKANNTIPTLPNIG